MNTILLSSGLLAAGLLSPALSSLDGQSKCGQCPATGAKAALVSHTDKKSIVMTASEAGSFRTLLAAAKAAGLVEALEGKGPLTVFAPTDDAFGKLPKGTVESLLKPENKAALARILQHHIVRGDVRAADVVKLTFADTLSGQRVDIRVGKNDGDAGKVYVDGANVVTADLECTNGVIHVIDTVMLPADKNLAETAMAAGTFNTLVAAAKAAGLVEALSGDKPLTIFAPTDEAFAKLPKGTVESLLLPENKERLASILKYHIVAGRVYADQAVKLDSATTLQGGKLPIVVGEKGVTIGGAKISKTDIEATNGVIHVIDSVLLPG